MIRQRIVIGSLLALVLAGPVLMGPSAADPQATGEGGQPSPDGDSVERTAPVRRDGDLVNVFVGEIHIPAGVEQWGSIFSIGGDVTVEGRVRGDIFVIGGRLHLTGSVRGDVVGVLSNLTVHDAEIGKQLINIAGTLDEEGTSIGGQRVNIGFGEGWFTLARPFGVLGAVLFWARLLRLLIAFIVLVLLVTLVPERVRVISEQAPRRLFAAFFVGLLAYLALWIAIVLLAVTVFGIFLAWFLFLLLKWLGIAGMFHFFGHRVGRALGREMSLLGAVLLGFLPFMLIVLLPSAFGLAGLVVAALFWMLIWLFLEIPAVGLVILTRAGTLPPPPGLSQAPVPAAAPADPNPAAQPPPFPGDGPPGGAGQGGSPPPEA